MTLKVYPSAIIPCPALFLLLLQKGVSNAATYLANLDSKVPVISGFDSTNQNRNQNKEITKMAISFGTKYKRFAAELEKKHKLYEQLGMSQEQIDAIDEFDKEEFLSENNYRRHVQSLNIDEDSENPEDLHPLLKKFEDVLSVELKVTFRDKYAWLDEISSAELTRKLLSLAPEDLEILDAYVFGEETQAQIAREKGVSRKTISKYWNNIKRFLAEDQSN